MMPLRTTGDPHPAAAVFMLNTAPSSISSIYSLSATTTVPSYEGSLIEASIQSAFAAATGELERYKRYPPRWDGYRGLTFSSELLDIAAAILAYGRVKFQDLGMLPALVTTGPASDGSVDVEFRAGTRQLIFTLYPGDNVVRLSSTQPDGGRDDEAPLGEATLERWMDWVRGAGDLPPHLASHSTGPA
jgi:hypothetical protein